MSNAKVSNVFTSIDAVVVLCIGANWMHDIPRPSNNASLTSEGKQVPLWCWLMLCDDSRSIDPRLDDLLIDADTVITLHEDPGPVNNADALKSIRGNTYSVLSQLSSLGHLGADPISMQTVRQALELDTTLDLGSEGASNLFYYLFDDWRAVYSTISKYRQRLELLVYSHIMTQIQKLIFKAIQNP